MVSGESGGGGMVITPIPPAWTGESEPVKVHWRPPDYNAEDYVAGLVSRRSGQQASAPSRDEMSLKQFSSVSDLLAKLSADLRAAYPSFVQEFVCSPGLDGCSQLLETLRSVQVCQSSRRQALVDELACLQCLSSCFRCQETPHRLAQTTSGLFPLAACIMSNLNKSRILALQILCKVCEGGEGKGHGPVSDAMSTMRLRFGEPVRFKFLCGMLSSASPELLFAGLAFINSFLESAAEPQDRLYIQAELAQAGFSIHTIAKSLPSKVPCVESIRGELNRWERLHVDVRRLKSREGELVKEVHLLKDKVRILERKLQVLESEKSDACRSESRLKSRCSELEREVSSLRGGPASPAEDEGISSAGQDEREPLIYEIYANNAKLKEEEETTIDEVIEELQNIINDAESDIKEKRDQEKEREESALAKYYTKFMQRSTNDVPTNNLENTEAEIVPTKLIPYPPRRSRSLYFEREYSNDIFFDENETDNSDSLLSTSNEQIQYGNNPHNKAHMELLQREVQKSYVRRRETFHYPAANEIPPVEIKPDIKYRRGSLDGVFCCTDITPKKTLIYIDGGGEKRLTSKSLDRIEDGLDTMVDIVMMEDPPPPPLVRPIPLQRRKEDVRTVFLPIRDVPHQPVSASQTFLLKPCAGLYSGQQQKHPSTSISISDYYNKSLNGLNPSVTGKLHDLPSGLY